MLKRFLYILLLVCAAIPALADEWHRIVVQNPDGLSNRNVTFSFGDTCFMRPQHATFLKQAWDGLSLFRLDRDAAAAGTQCPPGTVFLEQKQTVEQWQQAAQQAAHEQKVAQEKIRKLLQDGK